MEYLLKKSLGKKRDSLLKDALPIFEEYYKAHSMDTTTLYPDVKEILEYFKNKRKAVITNRKAGLAAYTLSAFGIYNYFEDVIGGDDTGCMKPSSCPLDKAISKFKGNRKNSVIVGDMDIDVLAGKEAGILTCAVTYGIGRKEDIIKARPDYIINEISDLKEIIN